MNDDRLLHTISGTTGARIEAYPQHLQDALACDVTAIDPYWDNEE